jgi:hypothetical protein
MSERFAVPKLRKVPELHMSHLFFFSLGAVTPLFTCAFPGDMCAEWYAWQGNVRATRGRLADTARHSDGLD